MLLILAWELWRRLTGGNLTQRRESFVAKHRPLREAVQAGGTCWDRAVAEPPDTGAAVMLRCFRVEKGPAGLFRELEEVGKIWCRRVIVENSNPNDLPVAHIEEALYALTKASDGGKVRGPVHVLTTHDAGQRRTHFLVCAARYDRSGAFRPERTMLDVMRELHVLRGCSESDAACWPSGKARGGLPNAKVLTPGLMGTAMDPGTSSRYLFDEDWRPGRLVVETTGTLDVGAATVGPGVTSLDPRRHLRGGRVTVSARERCHVRVWVEESIPDRPGWTTALLVRDSALPGSVHQADDSFSTANAFRDGTVFAFGVIAAEKTRVASITAVDVDGNPMRAQGMSRGRDTTMAYARGRLGSVHVTLEGETEGTRSLVFVRVPHPRGSVTLAAYTPRSETRAVLRPVGMGAVAESDKNV